MSSSHFPVGEHVTAVQADVTSCASEPIHIPGGIQPHGLLLVINSADMRVVQASENAIDRFALGRDFGNATAMTSSVAAVVGPDIAERLHALQNADIERPILIGSFELGDEWFDAILHRSNAMLLLELERVDSAASSKEESLSALQSIVNNFAKQLLPLQDIPSLCQFAAEEMHRIAKFGRTLVYCFDSDGHGEVMGEVVNPGYDSYLGHRFPASDIPAQARSLYRVNHIRIIPDASYTPSRLAPPVNPVDERPTDLTFATLRAVSPIHLEYMRNMGTAASMSVSIVVRNQLWGLISCHDRSPRHLPFGVRTACEHLGQLLSLQVEAKETNVEAEHGLELRRTLVSLVAAMAESGGALESLLDCPDDLLRFAAATGAAVVADGRVRSIGETPPDDVILQLAEYLSTLRQELWSSERLQRDWPASSEWPANIGGALAISVSQLHRNFVIWFRPELVQTIKWAGDPSKPMDEHGQSARLHPRKSFATWREQLRGQSARWRDSELRAASEFRHALLNLVLRRAEEVASLAGELGRINSELEAFSYSVSHDLRAPLRHITGYADLIGEYEANAMSERGHRFLGNIKDSARFAGQLVDALLAFSQMGRSTLRPTDLNMKALVEGIIRNLRLQKIATDAEWKVGDLPIVRADPVFMQVALENLIGNALKYSATRAPARIEISGESTGDSHIIRVTDNGVGFDMKYVDKLFGVFQRLHRADEFEGTGIGLASVRRAVERHGGTVHASGKIDHGATFTIVLPLVTSSSAPLAVRPT
jgi:light-regulated signal transduction histidine kinase (bacteriophytochrome)